MFQLFNTSNYPIGIDAGTHCVRLLQFRKGTQTNELSLQAACRVELNSLPAPAEGWPVTTAGGTAAADQARVLAAIREGLSITGAKGAGQHFSGKRIVLSLPVSAVQAKSVRLPQMPDSDLSQALLWEAKDRFGFEVGENNGQLVWFRAGEVRRGTEVKDELLLFAVSGEILNGYIQGLSAMGLKIAAIDLAPSAAQRGIQRILPTSNTGETAAMLDLGHGGSQFCITRDGELVFYKNIDIGGRAINEAIATKLGISSDEACQMRCRLAGPASASDETAPLDQALRDAMRGPLEELARELDMCMRYYVVTFRGSRPLSIAVTGRQAASPDIQEVLAGALGLQVEQAQSLRGVQNLGETTRPDKSGEWAAAAGLSLYPMEASRMEAAA